MDYEIEIHAFHQMTKAKEIVIQQDLPSGDAPTGLYLNASNITHSCFDEQSQELRDQVVAKNMDFLHALMLAKLKHVQALRAQERSKRKSNNAESEQEENEAEEPEEGIEVVDGKAPALIEDQSTNTIEAYRLTKVRLVLFLCKN